MQYLSSEETRRLVDVLSKHPLVRTEDDLRAVDAFARHVPFFARLSPSQRLQLYRWCSLVELDRGSILFRQGDPGEEFFVIIEGEVRVFVRVSETRRLDDLRKAAHAEDADSEASLTTIAPELQGARTIASLGQPESFGEIALTGDNRRSAGVVAFRRTILLCLHKRQYLETMSKWMEVEVADKKRVLLATPLFCDLPADEIDSLVRDAALRKAGASADLVVEGQPLDEWFVVATGVLRVLRFVDAEEELPVDPQTGRPCAMVGEMSRFSHYGAGEVVFGSMHALSTLRAATNATVLVLPRERVWDLMAKHAKVRAACERHAAQWIPDDASVSDQLQRCFRWSRFKQAVMTASAPCKAVSAVLAPPGVPGFLRGGPASLGTALADAHQHLATTSPRRPQTALPAAASGLRTTASFKPLPPSPMHSHRQAGARAEDSRRSPRPAGQGLGVSGAPPLTDLSEGRSSLQDVDEETLARALAREDPAVAELRRRQDEPTQTQRRTWERAQVEELWARDGVAVSAAAVRDPYGPRPPRSRPAARPALSPARARRRASSGMVSPPQSGTSPGDAPAAASLESPQHTKAPSPTSPRASPRRRPPAVATPQWAGQGSSQAWVKESIAKASPTASWFVEEVGIDRGGPREITATLPPARRSYAEGGRPSKLQQPQPQQQPQPSPSQQQREQRSPRRSGRGLTQRCEGARSPPLFWDPAAYSTPRPRGPVQPPKKAGVHTRVRSTQRALQVRAQGKEGNMLGAAGTSALELSPETSIQSPPGRAPRTPKRPSLRRGASNGPSKARHFVSPRGKRGSG